MCVAALLDPNALNKSVYVEKQKGTAQDGGLSVKFAALPRDTIK